ncbi:helix-turn-helix domain-containing protein [Arthrobacter sp. S2(2024)]|uniref:helix-turn-helix domain-containing protein n=1 Tax=Arthrobacter sp. S2(2024) TaxID=3111911 RepID=UPI002FCB9BEC
MNDRQEVPVSALMNEMGTRIRSLRKSRGLTVQLLSSLSGLSAGIVSQLERGHGNPSFTTLAQLAHALGVPAGQLLTPQENHLSPVVRHNERRQLGGHGFEPDGGVYELLTPDLRGALEVTRVVSMPGHDTSANPFVHQGEEFGHILSGTKDVYLDGERHRLGPGDSIRYASTIPHWYVNPTDEPCVAIWVITPPTW